MRGARLSGSIYLGSGIRRIYRKPAEQLVLEEWKEVAYNLGQGLRNLALILTQEKFAWREGSLWAEGSS